MSFYLFIAGLIGVPWISRHYVKKRNLNGLRFFAAFACLTVAGYWFTYKLYEQAKWCELRNRVFDSWLTAYDRLARNSMDRLSIEEQKERQKHFQEVSRLHDSIQDHQWLIIRTMVYGDPWFPSKETKEE